MASAQKLAWLGFQQQTKRPTLFLYQTGRWEIFGDLDSGDSVPVLYALRNGERECKECLLEAVGEIFTSTESRTGDALKIQKTMTMPYKQWRVISDIIPSA